MSGCHHKGHFFTDMCSKCRAEKPYYSFKSGQGYVWGAGHPLVGQAVDWSKGTKMSIVETISEKQKPTSNLSLAAEETPESKQVVPTSKSLYSVYESGILLFSTQDRVKADTLRSLLTAKLDDKKEISIGIEETNSPVYSELTPEAAGMFSRWKLDDDSFAKVDWTKLLLDSDLSITEEIKSLFTKTPEKKSVMEMPAGLTIVAENAGFVESKGPRGACFCWYRLVDSKWKPTHILHEENWMLKDYLPKTQVIADVG